MVSCLSHILQYSAPPPPSAGSLDKPSTSPVLCCEAEPPSISSYLHFTMTIYLQPIIPHCKCSGHRAVCFLLPAARDDLYLSIHHFTRLHRTQSSLGKWTLAAF